MKGVIFLRYAVLILIIIGALNWGLIGFFGFDLVASIFGGQLSLISRIIFAVVGVAGIYAISFLFPSKTVTE
ncbi:MAG: DUF378 domain-containing protein [Firmicutes bacterium]|nr:DUF378 domain-containing protein [Clostridiales bacterium]MBQ4340614.1 DUF378 domain-containing protein [Bacillota bacterium]